MSSSRLSNYLADKREPDLEMLASIAKYLGVDLNYFSNVAFSAQEPVVQEPVTTEQSDGIHIPCFRLNDKKKSGRIQHLLLDKRLIEGIDQPVLIVINQNTKGIFDKGAYVLASPLNEDEENGTIILEVGRRFNIYRYMKYQDTRFLYDSGRKACVNLRPDVPYYAVRWVLQ